MNDLQLKKFKEEWLKTQNRDAEWKIKNEMKQIVVKRWKGEIT